MKKLIFITLFILNGSILLAQPMDETDRYFELSKNIEIYNQIIKELNADYLKPIQPQRLLKVSMNAMLGDLDPYTQFYSEYDVEDYRLAEQGNIEALGISVINKGGLLIISGVQKGSPVLEAGIPVGSSILEINGQSLAGKTEEEITTLFNSSTISLKIQDLEQLIKEIQLTRKSSAFKTVRKSQLMGINKDIAYVSLGQFMHSSDREIMSALQAMQKEVALKGVILDLRGNPGGLLDQAINIANVFLPKDQEVVSVKGQRGVSSVLSTKRTAWDTEIPLIILINQQSASASEIVAGTIQDLDRGVIVGARSYGKGLVQHVRPLAYNTRLKLTTGEYFIPSGRSIQSIDYAIKNEDGSIQHIPEEKRKIFKTINGRSVKDGGGVEPDIYIEEEKQGSLLIALKTHYIIFDFVTEYYKNNSAIINPEQFYISEKDWNNFKQYVGKNNASGKIILGESWWGWQQAIDHESLNPKVLQSIKKFEQDMKALQSELLEEDKKSLSTAISEEIVRRYHQEEGVQTFLFAQPDASLSKAIQLIEQPIEYEKILKR